MGSKGKPPTKPHYPSRLRNEVLAESVTEDEPHKESHVEVPGSDTVIPETQLDDKEYDLNDIDDDREPGDGGSDHPMSPKSHALLSRNQASMNCKVLAPLPEIQFLSRPSDGDAPNTSFSFKPPKKTHRTQIPEDETTSLQDIHTTAGTAPDFITVVKTNGESTLAKVIRTCSANLPCIGGTAEENQRTSPDVYHVESSVQPDQELPTPTPPQWIHGTNSINITPVPNGNSILHVASYPVVEDLHTNDV
jgi:hypothetical protein